MARWARRLGGLAVLAGAAYLVHRLVAEVGWDEVAHRLSAASRAGVAVAVALLLLHLTLWATRQHLTVRQVADRPAAWAVMASLAATAAANYLIPFARIVGGLLRARYLSRASRPRIPKRVYYGAVLFDQTVHLAVMGSFAVGGLVVGLALAGRSGAAVAVAAVVMAGATGGILWMGRRGDADASLTSAFVRFLERRAESKRGPIGHLLASSESAAKIYLALVANAALWRRGLGLGLGLFAALAASQWVVFRALGSAVDPLLVVATLAMGLTAGVLLGTPGGLGTTEATMIAVYGALGVERVDAASAVLLFRALQFAVILGLGLPSMAGLELYGHDRSEEGNGDRERAADAAVRQAREGAGREAGPGRGRRRQRRPRASRGRRAEPRAEREASE